MTRHCGHNGMVWSELMAYIPHLPRNPMLHIGALEHTVQHSQNLIRPTALGWYVVYGSRFIWASLKTPQIENTVVSTFFITEFTFFLNACIKRFGEKDVMNEIKK